MRALCDRCQEEPWEERLCDACAAKGAAEERKAIVRWLRAGARAPLPTGGVFFVLAPGDALALADVIEHGRHLEPKGTW